MNIVDRFISYCKIPTMSSEESITAPSTLKQFALAKQLVSDLENLGLNDITLTDECIVYAHLKANTDKPTKKIGFVAHMDTSPDMNDEGCNPRIIENYNGEDIVLNKELNIVMTKEAFPHLKKDIGSDLIVTDGTTLLGGDDKAGIAAIMDMLQTLKENPEIKHGQISIAFTPDEEVGRGTENFSCEMLDADYAYTVDGSDVNDIEYENFNAATAVVKIKGLSIHPGDAKDKMINAIRVAEEFDYLLPMDKRPECTEGYEGFNHCVDFKGSCESAVMTYIIRNHDLGELDTQKHEFYNAQYMINKKYGDICEVEIAGAYRNMKEAILPHMEIVDDVKEKMKKLGLEPVSTAIRGGTDGASITYMGIPCPNLGTGDRNCHGKFEYVSINELKLASKLLVEIVKVD